jgi:glycopeptide antibiotics resistance protein
LDLDAPIPPLKEFLGALLGFIVFRIFESINDKIVECGKVKARMGFLPLFRAAQCKNELLKISWARY